jgi:hypothetical protein
VAKDLKQMESINRALKDTITPSYVPPRGDSWPGILSGEDLLQIVFLPAMTIGHKDSVLIMGDHLGHVLSVILLVILSNVGIEGVVWVGRVWGVLLVGA